MERLSTYSLLGIPEALATAVVLICLSLSLAPWIGGTELGPLKVPKLPQSANRWLRIAAPIAVVFFAFGFFKVWANKPTESRPLTYGEYVDGFVDTSRTQATRGEPFPLSELEVRELKSLFGSTRWDGGPHWGTVNFDNSGRRASYTNLAGRSPGTLLIQVVPRGTIPILGGEWQQQDMQSGRIMFSVPTGVQGEQISVYWGPSFVLEAKWRRVP